MGSIYMIVNNINNKKYIGQTMKPIQERFKEHIREARHNTHRYLYHAMNKYGVENFSIIELESDVSDNELNEREQYYIEKYNTFNDGYNLTEGGGGIRGWHHSEESRKNMSISIHKAFPKIFTEERAQKISKALKGRHLSEEHKKHLSESRLKYPYRYCKEANGFYKKHHTIESKQKMHDSSIKYDVIQLDKDKITIINIFNCVEEAARYIQHENITKAKLSSIMYRIYTACQSENIYTYHYYWKYKNKV